MARPAFDAERTWPAEHAAGELAAWARGARSTRSSRSSPDVLLLSRRAAAAARHRRPSRSSPDVLLLLLAIGRTAATAGTKPRSDPSRVPLATWRRSARCTYMLADTRKRTHLWPCALLRGRKPWPCRTDRTSPGSVVARAPPARGGRSVRSLYPTGRRRKAPRACTPWPARQIGRMIESLSLMARGHGGDPAGHQNQQTFRTPPRPRPLHAAQAASSAHPRAAAARRRGRVLRSTDAARSTPGAT